MSTQRYPYRLDNAAKIFPGMLSRRRTTVFRLAATIDQPVNVRLLQAAYAAMLDRCPYYNVELRRGLFWYYLETSNAVPRVEAESRYPCIYIPYRKRGVRPHRVVAYKDRIALEISHLLTDGTGALAFLNGILFEYLSRRGESVSTDGLFLDPRAPIDEREYEDSFTTHYQKGIPPAPRQSRALRFGGKAVKPPAFFFVEGTVANSDLKHLATEKEVTIGEYLTALLIDTALREMKERGLSPKPIRGSIPINLRRFYRSQTMRNFVLAVEPGIDPRLGEFTFDDIIAKVHHFMRFELDHRFIRRQFARNIGSERNPFIRIVPVLLKDAILTCAYSVFGTGIFTIGFSNLGRVTLPEDMKPFVRDYTFIPPPHNNALNATSISYDGRSHLIFASTTENTRIERRFFSTLRGAGIHVSIRTNRR